MSVDWTTAPLPKYEELPPFKNFPGCAWGVWGDQDELGTVNLLTDTLVKQTAAEEIRFVAVLSSVLRLISMLQRLGRSVSLNWRVAHMRIRSK
jgi:hypothetical protein